MAEVKNKTAQEHQPEQNDEQMKKIYREQKKVGILSFLAELPNFIAVLVSAILSRSLIMWLDLVDSFSNVARSSSIFLSSGRLEGKKVQDPEKLEFRVAMFCNISVLIGILILLGTSICQIFDPSEPQAFLLVAVILKVINVTIDVYMFVRQSKILRQGETAIVRAEYNGLLKDTIFDSVTLFIVLISYFLIKHKWSWYISPVMCLLMCLFFIGKYINDIRLLVKKHREYRENNITSKS